MATKKKESFLIITHSASKSAGLIMQIRAMEN